MRQWAVHHHELAGVAARVAKTARLHAAAQRLESAAFEGAGGGRPFTITLPRRLPSDGRSFRMLPNDGADLIVRQIAQLGWHGFERPMPDLFVALANRLGGTVIDVGANTGFYSLLACVASSGSRVVAFEPFPPVVPLLEANVSLNQLEERVNVSPLAISDTAGESILYIPVQDHGLVESSCSLNESFKEKTSGTVPVQMTTLDAYVRDAALRDVRILKIDVESLEHAVLAGAEATLVEQRPLVFVEVLHIGEPDAIEATSERAGYVDIRLLPDQAIVGEAVRHDPRAWNHLLVPAEELAVTAEVLGALGLVTVDRRGA